MTGHRLEAADCEAVADLHLRCFPDSAVARLGTEYVLSFYRYLCRSVCEHGFVHRDQDHRVDGACVLSSAPWSLNRRLWAHTPLAPRLCRRIGSDAATLLAALSPSLGAIRFVDATGARAALRVPEIILIFVDARRRRLGIGAELLRRAEARLGRDSHPVYAARTRDDPADPAWSFYRASGFVARGGSKRFHVWEKTR